MSDIEELHIDKSLPECFMYTLDKQGIYGFSHSVCVKQMADSAIGLHGSRIQGLVPLSVARKCLRSDSAPLRCLHSKFAEIQITRIIVISQRPFYCQIDLLLIV